MPRNRKRLIRYGLRPIERHVSPYAPAAGPAARERVIADYEGPQPEE